MRIEGILCVMCHKNIYLQTEFKNKICKSCENKNNKNRTIMKIQLIDFNREMISAWQKYFANITDVEIHQNSAFSIPTDCVVSPSNGRGFLDGGFDAAITKNLGSQVQQELQSIIKKDYHGELLVGQAILFETKNPTIPYCISAPTMRCPMYLGPKSVNAYLAARAIFIILKNNPPFKTVTIPGLGTGVGAVPFETCAKQMRQAYDDFYVNDVPAFPTS